MTWSPEDLVNWIEGQDLEEKTKLFLGMKEGKFHVPLEHTFSSFTGCITWSCHDLVGRIEDKNLQERRKDETCLDML